MNPPRGTPGPSRRRMLALLLPAALAAPSCSSVSRTGPPVAPAGHVRVAPAAKAPLQGPKCARTTSIELPRAVGEGDISASIVLARAGDRTLAYIADEEDRALRVVDLARGTDLGATPLSGAPSDALVLPDGRVAVSLRDAHAIAVLEPDADPAHPFTLRCTVDVATEPSGMALTKDRASVLVASRWGHALTSFDAGSFERRFVVDLPRDPRAIAVSFDGKTALVSHVTGARISSVDLEGGDHASRSIDVRDESLSRINEGLPMSPPAEGKRPPRMQRHHRFGGQGYALARTADGRVLAAHTLAEPSTGGSSSGGYGGGGEEHPPVVADIGVVTPDGRLAPARFGPLTVSDCLLPRAIAVDAAHDRVLVACRGLDRVLTFDAKAAHPHDREIGRTRVGAGPTGIAVDPDAGHAYVWSTFDRTIADVVTTGAGKDLKPERRIEIARRSPAPAEDVVRGQALFFAASARRLAADGRACASCHPDGRDDGLTWSTPEGPRQTPMLAGRLEGTAPYGWDGARPTLLGHLDRTLERLHGVGIDAAERASLFAYVASMKVPKAREEPAAAVARGKEIFDSDEAGCGGCHAGSASTDGLRHDVKSRAPLDQHTEFDTPSLRFVGRTAPFFHDGRYATLGELLRQSDGKMGHTGHLADDDLSAVEAYLESL